VAQLNISLPPQLKDWVDMRIEEGRYASASDYVRDLLRRDQERATSEETEWLRGLIAEGLTSGVVDGDAKSVLRDIMAEHPVANG
jgi:antitoxin ParD1/3/4